MNRENQIIELSNIEPFTEMGKFKCSVLNPTNKFSASGNSKIYI